MSNFNLPFLSTAQVMVIDFTTVFPPTNTMATRTAADEAMVTFEAQSLGDLQIRYYIADDPSSPDLVCKCLLLHINNYNGITFVMAESICWQY